MTQHVLHPVTPNDPDTLIGGIHGMRVYASWAEVPASAHQRLHRSTQRLKVFYDTELRGREVSSTMLRILRFFAHVSPDIVSREANEEWTAFPLNDQPGVAALLHPEEPDGEEAARAWLSHRRPGGEARVVCNQVDVDGTKMIVGFTFARGYSFLPFAETSDQVAADIVAGYPYVTGDIGLNTTDASKEYPHVGLVLASNQPIEEWTSPFDGPAGDGASLAFGDDDTWRRQALLNGMYLVYRARRLYAVIPDL